MNGAPANNSMLIRSNGSLVIWLNQPTRIIDRTANGS